MMHNGRIFKEGAPDEIENDEEVQAIYLGAAMDDRPQRRQKAKPILQVRTCRSITASRMRFRASR